MQIPVNPTTPLSGAVSYTVDPTQRRADTVQASSPVSGVARVGADNSQPQGKSAQDELKEAVQQLNETAKLYSSTSSLNFSINDEIDAVVVKVLDGQTEEVIRQIPSEQAIAIAKAIDQFKGLLIKDRA
ncbi:flagellar protein FlaG [Chitinibacteraceae bacterium HSL-7]